MGRIGRMGPMERLRMQMPFSREEIEAVGMTLGVLGTLIAAARWLLGLHWKRRAEVAEAALVAAKAHERVDRLQSECEECRADQLAARKDLWTVVGGMRTDIGKTALGVARIQGHMGILHEEA